MKLRDFIEQLQQLDPDADVKICTEEGPNENGLTRVVWEEPVIQLRMLGRPYSGERRTVCLE